MRKQSTAAVSYKLNAPTAARLAENVLAMLADGANEPVSITRAHDTVGVDTWGSAGTHRRVHEAGNGNAHRRGMP